jgi:hypothetical protein
MTEIKTARPLGVKPLNEKEFANKYVDRKRNGKTAKDHASGAHAARFANRAARVEWQQDKNAGPASFPGHG